MLNTFKVSLKWQLAFLQDTIKLYETNHNEKYYVQEINLTKRKWFFKLFFSKPLNLLILLNLNLCFKKKKIRYFLSMQYIKSLDMIRRRFRLKKYINLKISWNAVILCSYWIIGLDDIKRGLKEKWLHTFCLNFTFKNK